VSESILLFDSIQFLVVGLGSTYCNGMLYVYVVFLCVVLVGCFVSTSCSLVSMMMLHQKSKYRRKSFKNNVVTHICTVQYYSSIILAPQDVRNHDVMMDRRENVLLSYFHYNQSCCSCHLLLHKDEFWDIFVFASSLIFLCV